MKTIGVYPQLITNKVKCFKLSKTEIRQSSEFYQTYKARNDNVFHLNLIYFSFYLTIKFRKPQYDDNQIVQLLLLNLKMTFQDVLGGGEPGEETIHPRVQELKVEKKPTIYKSKTNQNNIVKP